MPHNIIHHLAVGGVRVAVAFLLDVVLAAGVGIDGKQHHLAAIIVGGQPVIFDNIVRNHNEINQLFLFIRSQAGKQPAKLGMPQTTSP